MHVSLKIDYQKIEVIHPGIDIYDGFISDSDKQRINGIIRNKSPVMTTLARVEERKGHAYTLNAVAKLKKEVRVAITGAGSCVFRSKEL